MNATSLLPLLGHVDMRFVCEDLGDRARQAAYHVPLCHRPLTHSFYEENAIDAGKAALDALPSLQSTATLRSILSEGIGIGQWAPRQLVENADRWRNDPEVIQLMAGSIAFGAECAAKSSCSYEAHCPAWRCRSPRCAYGRIAGLPRKGPLIHHVFSPPLRQSRARCMAPDTIVTQTIDAVDS